MNFTEAVDAVVDITKRPDKRTAIQREVNSAINFCTVEGNFARDVSEGEYAIDPALYAQSLALTEFERWRKFAYIKIPSAMHYIKHTDPSQLFAQNKEQSDAYYVVGDGVKFKLCKLASALYVGHFTYPPTLTDANPSYWLLDVSPYMIIAKAAQAIFSEVGNNTEASAQGAMFATMFNSAVRDYKYGADYG